MKSKLHRAWRAGGFRVGAIEGLEPRIAPASVITYTDIDGDKVTITATKGHLSAALLQLSGGDHGQLQVLNLSDPSFNGTSITFTVHRVGNAGDGLAAVGMINGGTNNFGTITVDGDLGAIDCGSGSVTTPALESLRVRSMGEYGLAPQGGSDNLFSQIDGKLGALHVASDVKDAAITVTIPEMNGIYSIGSVSIGGSLVGGASGGEIGTNGSIGPIKIGGDVVGGSGANTGEIFSSDGGSLGFLIGSVRIGGSLIGGGGAHSGEISSGAMGDVTVGGNVIGGSASDTGEITSVDKMGEVRVGGSVIGGSGYSDTGEIGSSFGIKSVFVGHNVVGGSGLFSSGVIGAGVIGTVTINGSLVGGTNASALYTGRISAMNLGMVTIGHDIIGGAGQSSGDIFTGGLSALTIGGSLIGGPGTDSGEVATDGGERETISVAHDVEGGTGAKNSGIILVGGVTKSVTIGGSIIGGTNSSGTDSGEVSASSFGTLKIGHDVLGGAAANSGFINATGVVPNAPGGAVSIGGSLIGGSGPNTGEIQSAVPTGVITIGHDLRGGGIASGSLDSSGAIFVAGNLAGVSIGGSIMAGVNDGSGALTNSAAIHVGNSLGFLSVGGSIVGSVGAGGAVSKVVVSAQGATAPTATSDLAIGQISVHGRVEQTQFLAGYDQSLNPVDGHAQIGKVSVGGDWIASDLVAGVQEAAAADGFGGGSDFIIGHPASTIAKIASIVIKGIVVGTPAAGDQFGFESAAIGSFTLAGTKLAATSSFLLSPITGGDVSVEIVGP